MVLLFYAALIASAKIDHCKTTEEFLPDPGWVSQATTFVMNPVKHAINVNIFYASSIYSGQTPNFIK